MTVREAVRAIADGTNMRHISTVPIGLYDRNKSTWLDDDKLLEHYWPAANTYAKNLEFRERADPSAPQSPPPQPSSPLAATLPAPAKKSAAATTTAPQVSPSSLHASARSSVSLPARLTRGISKRLSMTQAKKEELARACFQPPPPSYDDIDGMLWVTATMAQGGAEVAPIPAMFIEFADREAPGAQAWFTVLYCGDTDEDMGIARRSWLGILVDVLRVNVFAFDFTGYGRHEGVPSEEACYRDISTAYLFLTTVKGIPGERIIICAKGLGSGAALYLGQMFSSSVEKAPFSVKDVSFFKSIASTSPAPSSAQTVATPTAPAPIKQNRDRRLSMTTPIEPPKSRENPVLCAFGEIKASLFGGDLFDNMKRAPKVASPVLIIHGSANHFVSLTSAKKLASQFSKLRGFFEVQGASHANILDFCDDFLDPLAEFLQEVSKGRYVLRKQVREAPAEYATSPSLIVTKWLEARGFGVIAQQVLSAGYYDLQSLKTLTSEELDGMGIEDAATKKVLLALISQAKSLTDISPSPHVVIDRQITAGVVHWSVALVANPSAEPKLVGMEMIAHAEPADAMAWIDAAASYEARLRTAHEEKLTMASASGGGSGHFAASSNSAAVIRSDKHHKSHKEKEKEKDEKDEPSRSFRGRHKRGSGKHHRGHSSSGSGSNEEAHERATHRRTKSSLERKSPDHKSPEHKSPEQKTSKAKSPEQPAADHVVPVTGPIGSKSPTEQPPTAAKPPSAFSPVVRRAPPEPLATKPEPAAASSPGSPAVVRIPPPSSSSSSLGSPALSPLQSRMAEIREDPLHELVRKALPAGASAADISAQVQILFSEGVFGINTLRATAQGPRWKRVSRRLAEPLSKAIEDEFCPLNQSPTGMTVVPAVPRSVSEASQLSHLGTGGGQESATPAIRPAPMTPMAAQSNPLAATMPAFSAVPEPAPVARSPTTELSDIKVAIDSPLAPRRSDALRMPTAASPVIDETKPNIRIIQPRKDSTVS